MPRLLNRLKGFKSKHDRVPAPTPGLNRNEYGGHNRYYATNKAWTRLVFQELPLGTDFAVKTCSDHPLLPQAFLFSLTAKSVMDPQRAAESNLPRFLTLTGLIHIIALISVGLRLYVRIGMLRTPGRDDVAVTIASVLASGGWISFIVQGYHGLGRHTAILSTEDLKVFDKMSFVHAIVSAIGALGMLKISIALFLLRLSKNRWYSRTLWALIGVVIIYTFGAWLSWLLYCRPIAYFWDDDLNGTCYPIHLFISFAMANTGFNIATDVLFASLPIPIIWGLQMSRRTRGWLIGVLSLGYLAVAMGIIKAVYQLGGGGGPDRTFESSIQFWGFIQLNVGIIASTIPTLKPLLKRTFGTSTSNRYNQFDGVDRLAGGTIGSGMKPSRLQDGFPGSMHTKADEGNYEMTQDPRDRKRRSAKTHVYGAHQDRTGSEDHILEHGLEDPKRIMCTTEVVVDNVRKGDTN